MAVLAVDKGSPSDFGVSLHDPGQFDRAASFSVVCVWLGKYNVRDGVGIWVLQRLDIWRSLDIPYCNCLSWFR